jgi:hypothetical protein
VRQQSFLQLPEVGARSTGTRCTSLPGPGRSGRPAQKAHRFEAAAQDFPCTGLEMNVEDLLVYGAKVHRVPEVAIVEVT